MKRSIKLLTNSIAITAGITRGLTTLAATTEFPESELGTATHETRAESHGAPQSPDAANPPRERQTVSAAPATRATLMANWETVSGANGYLLDVSTDDSFS